MDNNLHTLRPEQNNHCFSDIFQVHFLEVKFCLVIQITLKFVPEGPIDNNSALV